MIVDSEKKIARRVVPLPEEPAWFAMSAPYCRELKARDALLDIGITCYVPMRYQVIQKGRIKKRKLVPVIHNLIFVYERRSIIDQLKRRIGYLQYRTTVKDGKNVPMVVPPKQMEDFRRVCESENDKVKVLLPGSVSIAKGTRVRIISGELSGVEGVFVKVAGNRGHSVIVEIPGLATVISATISPDLIEVIE